MKISCIIPAFNEGPRIEAVVSAAVSCSLVSEVVVVDDCSTDDTELRMAKYKGVSYVRLEKNMGKSKAVCEGVRRSSGDIIFFLDADLMGLTSADISDLLLPVVSNEVDMAISLRHTYPTKDRLSQFLGIDHLSGERAFRKTLITPYLDTLAALPGFGLETFLNTLIVQHSYSLRIVKWNTVFSPLKSYKYNVHNHIADIKDYMRMWKQVLKVAPFHRVIRNIYAMMGLRKFSTPTVSLVIPAYNEEKYLAACLQKTLENSGSGFLEIIVVDNASTDKTAEIAGRFSNVRVVHEARSGVTHARQRGFQEAKGDIVAYIDADSYCMPGWAKYIAREFGKTNDLVSLSGICKYYDLPWWQNVFVWTYWRFLAIPIYWMLGYMMIGGNFAIRKSVLEKMGGFDTSIVFYGDDTNTARRAKVFGRVDFKTDFFIYTSGRRLAKQGLVNVGVVYVVNFFSEVFLHKPHTKEAKNYR